MIYSSTASRVVQGQPACPFRVWFRIKLLEEPVLRCRVSILHALGEDRAGSRECMGSAN